MTTNFVQLELSNDAWDDFLQHTNSQSNLWRLDQTTVNQIKQPVVI